MIPNAIFLKHCWHLKVTQSFMRFRVNQAYMFLSQSNILISSLPWIFISSPVGFLTSPVENLLLGLTPQKFWKFGIFPSELWSPYPSTETRCFSILYFLLFLLISLFCLISRIIFWKFFRICSSYVNGTFIFLRLLLL